MKNSTIQYVGERWQERDDLIMPIIEAKPRNPASEKTLEEIRESQVFGFSEDLSRAFASWMFSSTRLDCFKWSEARGYYRCFGQVTSLESARLWIIGQDVELLT